MPDDQNENQNLNTTNSSDTPQNTTPEEKKTETSNEPQSDPTTAPTSTPDDSANGTPDPASAEPGSQEPAKTDDAPSASSDPVEEEYELELADDSLISDEDLAEFAEEAARLNLPKAEAEKLLGMMEAKLRKGMESEAAKHQARIDEAAAAIKADPLFATPEVAEQTFESMSRPVETFGDNDLVELLKDPTFGNNVVLARFLKRLGDAMAPDTIPNPHTGSNLNKTKENENSVYKSMYPEFFNEEQK